jgi:hypothetical protein
MKNTHTARPRTLALLLAATVLPATPVLAQEAAAPPPVVATVPQPEAPAAPAAAPAPVFAPQSEVVQPLPERAAPAPQAAAPAPRTTAARTARPTVQPSRSAVAPVTPPPVAAEPAPVMTPAPVAQPVETPIPDAVPTADTTTARTTTVTDQTPWMWIVGGLVALGALIALLFTRRRRPVDEVVYEEPVYTAPVAVAAPPVESVAYVEPAVVPVLTPAAKQAPATPFADDERPWIGLSLQATGSNAQGDSDLVEYNLIVENAGEVIANDVQVSTFLIDSRVKSSDAESSLIDAVSETQSRFIDLAPGTSVPIASTMSVPHGVEPHIIAEARYPLPGGGEGHIAARFVIEGSTGNDVEARLDDVLERV